jgi:hypothetical protein
LRALGPVVLQSAQAVGKIPDEIFRFFDPFGEPKEENQHDDKGEKENSGHRWKDWLRTFTTGRAGVGAGEQRRPAW